MQIEELVEAAARRMAVADGQNPDKLSHNSFEWWRHYVPMARAAIEAALSAAEPVAEPTIYVSRKSLEQLQAEGSHVAVQTLIHRKPLKSGNGVPLYATPSSPYVGVKALEWRKQAMSHSYGLFIRLARTSIGNYQISHGASGKYEVYLNKEPISAAYDGVPEAKAAAQADYESRIRSALSAQVQDVAGWQLVPKQPTEEMLDAYWGQTGESEAMRSRVHARAKIHYHVMLAAAPAKQEGGETEPVHKRPVENGESGDK